MSYIAALYLIEINRCSELFYTIYSSAYAIYRHLKNSVRQNSGSIFFFR